MLSISDIRVRKPSEKGSQVAQSLKTLMEEDETLFASDSSVLTSQLTETDRLREALKKRKRRARGASFKIARRIIDNPNRHNNLRIDTTASCRLSLVTEIYHVE